MISRDDIIGMCGLTEAEVDAVGEHEHLGGGGGVSGRLSLA